MLIAIDNLEMRLNTKNSANKVENEKLGKIILGKSEIGKNGILILVSS